MPEEYKITDTADGRDALLRDLEKYHERNEARKASRTMSIELDIIVGILMQTKGVIALKPEFAPEIEDDIDIVYTAIRNIGTKMSKSQQKKDEQ